MFRIILVFVLILIGCDKERTKDLITSTEPSLASEAVPPYDNDVFTVGEGSTRIVLSKCDTDVYITFYNGYQEVMQLIAAHGSATIKIKNGEILIGDIPVLGSQQPAIAGSNGTQADNARAINELLEACREHGLIARENAVALSN